MKRNFLAILTGVVLLLIFGMLLFMFQVRQTEVVVVTTFSKPTRQITQPGAYFQLPWPIQKVHKFDHRVHNFESQFEQLYTSDGYNLLIMTYVGWNISEPQVFFPRFGGSTKRAQESLEGVVRNAYSGVVGKHPFAHFISTDERQLKFAEIEKEMLERIQQDVRNNNYGIEVKFLGIKKLGLPESVTKLVFERMQSERQVLVTKIQSEGESEAQRIRTAANLESAKLLADAEAEATRIRGQGDAEAAKYFQVFEQEPALATFLLNLSGLEAFLKDRTTLILDQDTPPLQLLKTVPVSPAAKPALTDKSAANPESSLKGPQQASKLP